MVEEMAETLRDESETEEEEEHTLSESDVVASISFGRFESDMLCWERWSSFSQNKYLEEVEKCSTPGSVAEKKAYFEAHYKKIAAQKAEIIEHDQQLEVDSFTLEYPSDGNPTRNGCGRSIEFNDSEIDVVSRADIDEPDQDGLGVYCQGSLAQEIHETIEVVASAKEGNPLTSQSQEPPRLFKEEAGSQTQVEELPVLIQEENHSTGEQTLSEKLPVLVKQENSSTELETQCEEVNDLIKEEINSTGSKNKLKQQRRTNIAQVNKAKDTTLKHLRKDAQKRPASSKEKNLARTKTTPTKPDPRPVSRPTHASASRTSKPDPRPVIRPTHASASRTSKPSPASPVITTARTSTRKESTPSILKNANVSTVESKRSTSDSHHMSVSMASSKSDSTSLTTTRRSSFIMENMADKEIVKRAFKAFQSTYDPKPSIGAVDSPTQQIPKKVTNRIASSTTPQKNKQGPVKAAGVTQSTMKAASSFGLRSDEKAEKRREVSKKLDEKSKAKEAERTHLRSKAKEVKEAGTKKLQGNINSKTTTLPDRVSKSHVNKDNAIRHR